MPSGLALSVRSIEKCQMPKRRLSDAEVTILLRRMIGSSILVGFIINFVNDFGIRRSAGCAFLQCASVTPKDRKRK